MPHDMNEMQPQTEQTGQFRRIEQPLGNKVAVTLGGLGLIGLELWWFLLSKPKSKKAVAAWVAPVRSEAAVDSND
ncbi:hypothetical protein JVX88_20020 [Leptolyngbya sp. 7M]|nr:hypothetical protein JVX88_20020 [Leptolyngbya sp. 7M]